MLSQKDMKIIYDFYNKYYLTKFKYFKNIWLHGFYYGFIVGSISSIYVHKLLKI
jgi:hypothetical protein